MNELFLLFFPCFHLGNAANLNQIMKIIWEKKVTEGLRVNVGAQESRGARELLISPESGFNIPRKKCFRIWLKHSG